jgi:hypothetical protein
LSVNGIMAMIGGLLETRDAAMLAPDGEFG